ncbi:MAG: DUF6259 domain-containing protein [Fibrobacteria bacterium]
MRSLFSLLVLLTVSGYASELKLETPTAGLVLENTPSWHIQSIRFSANSFQINPREAFPLYQLEWLENGGLESLNSFQARVLSASKVKDTLKILFSHDKQQVRIECRVWADKDGLLWDASFRNDSKSGKAAIFRYPGIALAKAAKPLQAVLSIADGVRIRDAFDKLQEGESRGWNYPGMMSSQMTAWGDRAGGVVFYTADSAGYFKSFKVFRYHDHIIPTFEHIVVGNSAPAFSLAYKTVLAPFQGGWEEAADVYRKWAVKQPWCRKTIREKGLPAAVANPTFVLCSHVRLNREASVTDESPTIPRFSEAYRQALKMPVTNLFFSWEKHGPWVAPDYFPPYPSTDAFAKMSGLIHAQGNQTMVFLSGLNVTLDKTPRNGAPAYSLPVRWQDSLKASAIVGRDLRIYTEGTAQEGTGKRWVLCPATKAARDQILSGVQNGLDLKVDMIQIDQVVGGGVPPCFQEAHGHPWAGSNQVTHAFADILRQAHDKTYAKGAALSLEEPGEYFIPYLDIVHAREYMEGYWPREGNGIEGIALFSYLYHDYLLGYGGDAQLLRGPENAAVSMYEQAINLLAGRYPAGALWMQVPDYNTLEPQLRKVLVEVAAIWQSEARDFLMLGQARSLRGVFPDHDVHYNALGRRNRFTVPTILAKAYSHGDQEIALFINSTLESQPLNLKFLSDSRNLKTIWPPDRAGKPLDVSKPVPLGSYQVLILRRDK